MPILSIDSSNGYSNALIMDDNFDVIAEAVSEFHENHSVVIFEQIDKMLSIAGIKLDDLNGIAVSLGPGSFTGVRVSVAIAKTLSFCLGLNIIGLGSLFVFAYPFFKNNLASKYILTIKDTIKKNSYYASAFILENGDFIEYAKAAQFNSEELKSFITGFDSTPTTVYGYNRKEEYDRLRDELYNIVPIDPFVLDKAPYYAAKYALERGMEHNMKYIEELSPRYIYSDGPF